MPEMCTSKPDGPVRPMGLRPARPPVSCPNVVTTLLGADLGAKCLWVAWLAQRHASPACLDRFGSSCDLLGQAPLAATLGEIVAGAALLHKFGRWENQGHLITLWQVLSAVLVFVVRRSLYANPALFLLAMLVLLMVYYVGIMAEMQEDTEIRVPPFVPKSQDFGRPKHGWLGGNLAGLFRKKWQRVLVCMVLWMFTFTRTALFLYFGFISVEDDLRGLAGNLDVLFAICIFTSFVSLLPNFSIDLASWPDFFSDWMKLKRSSDVYRTDASSICTIDDDLCAHSQLKQQLKNHACRSLTVVLPAYMPNEEDILMEILEFYRQRETEYPGDFRVMLVWNSPNEHPEMEAELEKLMREWPSFCAFRCHWSTSKCDNLNMAIDRLETEMALLNDSDTLVSAETMCRGSINLFEHCMDIAQCHNIHCWEDFIGRPEGDSCFPFGAITTLQDGTKPINLTTQGLYKHSPFNGRGGFWRTEALKLVGFDYRIIGEDHDAAYRGFAYYGLKGVLDPNMLCMEREPPNCKALTNQRTRWETAALQMRRTFPWVLRSEHYTRIESFLLIWSQLSVNCQLPLQQLPLQMLQMIPLAVVKGYMTKHVFGDSPASLRNMCKGEDCIGKITINGIEVAFPLAFVLFLAIFGCILLFWVFDVALRTVVTRYRPRLAFCFFTAFLSPFVALPFRTYVQFWALYDFCWGNAKFICTQRAPSKMDLKASAVDVEQPTTLPCKPTLDSDLKKPLLESRNASLATMTTSASGTSLYSQYSLDLPTSASSNSLNSMVA